VLLPTSYLLTVLYILPLQQKYVHFIRLAYIYHDYKFNVVPSASEG